MWNTDLLPSTGPESFGLANIYNAQCEVLCKNLGICQIPTLIFDKQEKQKKAQARLDICALSTRMIICIFMCFW